jgi:hypothetical protein
MENELDSKKNALRIYWFFVGFIDYLRKSIEYFSVWCVAWDSRGVGFIGYWFAVLMVSGIVLGLVLAPSLIFCYPTAYCVEKNIKIGKWCPFCSRTAKGTIEEMQALAAKNGGKCLSTRYINARTKLKWQCAEGHTWMAIPSSIKNLKSWCPDCNKN